MFPPLGTGVMVKAVATAAGREPEVMGKPHKPIFDVLMEKFDLDPSKTLMVGDR